ncbi:MAG: bifunctional adenosylcobinamide kinase/adenosylcobinamide-phosphate guanylyltransferase [Dehalococcoidia bacterium]
MAGRCVLILGGARSGKSDFAQGLASELGERVLFVATAQALDDDMRRRIEEHRRLRPPEWRTLEEPVEVSRAIEEHRGDAQVVLLDCLTLLVSNIMLLDSLGDGPEAAEARRAESRITREIEGLVRFVDGFPGSLIIVSNEVGLGVVPGETMGRLYRDLLGRANQLVARRADRAIFMVAGIPWDVKGGGE